MSSSRAVKLQAEWWSGVGGREYGKKGMLQRSPGTECKGPLEHLLIYESGLECDSNVDLLKILGEMKENLSVL